MCIFLCNAAIAVENDKSINTPATVENTVERPLTSDSLYGLLVAEIAGSRQQYDIALKHYVQQARQTRDPQVAARATMIARYINATETSLEMSLLWVETAPKSKDALANAAQALVHSGRLMEAFEMAKRLHAQGGDVVYQNIAAAAGRLTKNQRERLLQSYKSLLPRYNRDEQLLVGIGLLLQQQGRFDEAMNYARRALTQNSESIPAAILEANLLHDLKRDREAITKMGKLLSLNPDNTSLRGQYAQLLTHYDLALAQQQFSILSEQLPNDADTILSLGIVAMERKDYRVANRAFERLLESDKHLSSAHYHLGRLAETQLNWSDAIFNYLQVERGNEFLPATTNLMDIFIRKGDFLSAQQHMNRVRIRVPDQSETLYLLHSQTLIKYKFLNEAERVLNESLQAHPESIKLLFARAMLHSSRRQVAEAERDLRRILQLESENAAALNSLGYLLADTTQRFKEAEELINRALALKPDDPVIIDSLGWLYFRTGKYIDALRELQRAYSAYPGTAVAAHLGEALWVTGAQVEARQIWQDGIKKAPDDPTIPATMKRLKVE